MFVRLFVRPTGQDGGRTNSSPPPIGGASLVRPCPGGFFMGEIDPFLGSLLTM